MAQKAVLFYRHIAVCPVRILATKAVVFYRGIAASPAGIVAQKEVVFDDIAVFPTRIVA